MNTPVAVMHYERLSLALRLHYDHLEIIGSREEKI